MNWLKKLVAKLFGIKHARPVPFDRPAKSVAFEAKGQQVVDTVKVNTPWEDAAETIRSNRMFASIPSQQPRKAAPKATLRPIDVIARLPAGTTSEQYLAQHKNPEEGDTVFIGKELWAWGGNGWVLINTLSDGKQKDRPVIRHPRPSMASRSSRGYNDPLLDTLIITQAVADDTPSSSPRTRQDSHRYEDSPSHSPSHHSTPSHSHSRDHDYSRDDNSGYDGGGSDAGGSSD